MLVGLVSAEGIESTLKRKCNNLQRSRWHVIHCFRCKAVRTARKWHGADEPSSTTLHDLGVHKPKLAEPNHSVGAFVKTVLCSAGENHGFI
jgi:hypothetical protein